MEEKILIQSLHYNVKKISIVMVVIGIVLSAIIPLVSLVNNYSFYSEIYHGEMVPHVYDCPCDSNFCLDESGNIIYKNVYGHRQSMYENTLKEFHPTVASYMECHGADMIDSEAISAGCITLFLMILLAVIFYLWVSKDALTVTDKRAYGKAAFGKRVDLPFDSISAVGTSWLNGVNVSTSSGRISFKLIKNQADIHSIMSKLLMERQNSEKQKNIQLNTTTSNADELKKFKDLLDNGIITQEEFDAKKKQLLGL